VRRGGDTVGRAAAEVVGAEVPPVVTRIESDADELAAAWMGRLPPFGPQNSARWVRRSAEIDGDGAGAFSPPPLNSPVALERKQEPSLSFISSRCG